MWKTRRLTVFQTSPKAFNVAAALALAGVGAAAVVGIPETAYAKEAKVDYDAVRKVKHPWKYLLPPVFKKTDMKKYFPVSL